MKTERLRADEVGISRAAELLLRGQLVAFPTETVYGLGACEMMNKLSRPFIEPRDDLPINRFWCTWHTRSRPKHL